MKCDTQEIMLSFAHVYPETDTPNTVYSIEWDQNHAVIVVICELKSFITLTPALLCVYILCNLYNLVWIVCPQMGAMYRIIRK